MGSTGVGVGGWVVGGLEEGSWYWVGGGWGCVGGIGWVVLVKHLICLVCLVHLLCLAAVCLICLAAVCLFQTVAKRTHNQTSSFDSEWRGVDSNKNPDFAWRGVD